MRILSNTTSKAGKFTKSGLLKTMQFTLCLCKSFRACRCVAEHIFCDTTANAKEHGVKRKTIYPIWRGCGFITLGLMKLTHFTICFCRGMCASRCVLVHILSETTACAIKNALDIKTCSPNLARGGVYKAHGDIYVYINIYIYINKEKYINIHINTYIYIYK